MVTAALGLIVAACGSDDGNAQGDNGESSAADRVQSAPAEVVTDDADGEQPSELAATEDDESTQDLGPRFPFTGVPADGPTEVAALNRSALVVKVDNHPRARPQTGLDQADMVFDVRAEGVTRFAAVFHSVVPDPVGPVRSSRTSDFDILIGLDNPLYASSGGNNYVAGKLRTLPIVELTNLTRTEYFRDFSRPAPHNLYVDGNDLYQLAPDDLPAPQPWFEFRSPGVVDPTEAPSTAATVTGPVTIDYTGSPTVTHTWDPSVEGWLRTQDSNPHTTAGGDQLAPENVVIMITDYSTSPADPISPEVRSTGSGPVIVLTNGWAIAGTWERPTAEDKPTLTDGDGNVITLTPGRTWVLMPEAGQVTFPDGQAPPGWTGLEG